MLVLSRKIDESIIINDDIEIKILSIDKGVVKLGIQAPKSISILRKELILAIKDFNQSASIQHVKESILQDFYTKLSKK